MDVEKREQVDEQCEFLLEEGGACSGLGRNSKKASSAWKSNLRLVLEIVMGFMIVGLSIRSWPERSVVKPSAVPNCMYLGCDAQDHRGSCY